MVRSRRTTAIATALLLAFGALARVSAQNEGKAEQPRRTEGSEASDDELTDDARDAIQRGLDSLASWQVLSRTGAWHGPLTERYDVAVTSLCGLAFLGAGEMPGRGRFASKDWNDPVRRAIEFVLRNQSHAGPYPGLFHDEGDGSLGNQSRPMHGHGFALLFLAEAYGQTSEPALRARMHDAIVAAVALTSKAQSPDGGWHYLPDGRNDEGSVTVTQIQGLRAARNAGILVDKKVIDRAVDYIRKSQEEDGGIRYTIRYGHSSVALTAAGMSVIYGSGEYDAKILERGFKYLRVNVDTQDIHHRFYYYTQLYLAQAMHQRGGPDWAAYFPRAREDVLRQRGSRGVWDDGYVGKPFATACALLVLEVPLRYLPIFQR